MATREQKEARLTALSAELALGLYLRSLEGQTVAELAAITCLPVGLVAGLIAKGRKLAAE